MATYVFDRWPGYGSTSRPDFDDAEMDGNLRKRL